MDDAYLRQLTELYRQRLRPGSDVLELGASHVSHLPPGVPLVRAQGGRVHLPCAFVAWLTAPWAPARAQTVVGTGLNAEEVRRAAAARA